MRKINKGAWSKHEDQKLLDYITTHGGEVSWGSLLQAAGLDRGKKSCRIRWMNNLRPDLERRKFGEDEEDLIIKLHALLGNRWSLIAGRLPGRTGNEVKYYWNFYIQKKMNKNQVKQVSHRVESSGSRNQTSQPAQSNGSNDQVPDVCGSIVEDDACGLMDLNLDLTLTNPSPPLAEEVEQTVDLEPTDFEIDCKQTLLLFR